MSDFTRRNFLAAAGAGTVAGVAAVAVPQVAAASPEETETLPPDAAGAMAAYIHDVRKGEVLVMVEGREVVFTDRKLVARLARAFARVSRA